MEPDETVAVQAQNILEIGQGLLGQALVFVESLLRPWNFYQILIALGLFALAHILRAILAPRLYGWMRTREGWPRWRMRYLVVVHKRLRAIFFVALIWVVVLVMREVTWPSRSYLLGIIGNLVLAWLIVAFATRLISNGLLRGIVRYGAWAWITLRILGLTEEAETLLDTVALNVGETRISVLLVLQALLSLGVLIFAARFVSRTATSRIEQNDEISPSMLVLAV